MNTGFLIKKSSGSGVVASLANKSITEPNYQPENGLQKQIIRKFKRRKVYSHFRENIWGVDLADMQSLSKYNKGIKYLLCAIDLFSKHVWVVLLKDKKGISIVNAFQKIISKGRKPNKIWVDQGGEFYNNLFKRFLKINNIEMYSTHNEGKSVVAEKFIRTLKSKSFKHMTAISKNAYFAVLHDIVNKYNNTVHRTITTKPIDVTSDSYAEYNDDSNEDKPKFKVGDHVRILIYKNVYAQSWSKEVFAVSKIKDTVLWAYVISDLNGESIAGAFYEKELQKTNQKELRIEKVLKEKVIKCMSSGKDTIVVLIVGLIKKTFIKMSQYFPKKFRSFGGNINVKIDLSNYGIRTDLKNVTHVDNFALKTNLASLKTEVDKLDIDQLATVPVDLSKLSEVVKNDVVKKAVYDNLAAKVNNIDTSDFALKTKYQTYKAELEKKLIM